MAAAMAGAYTADAQAQTVSYKTSTGKVLVFKKVDTLDCAGLQRALDRLEAAGYRSRGQTSFNHPHDQALFAFEEKVSARSLRKCWAVQKRSFGMFSNDANIRFGR